MAPPSFRRAEGQLAPAEFAELVAIVHANSLLGILRTEARAMLVRLKLS